jgi:LuxR family maltose regulon positive regulatory protein
VGSSRAGAPQEYIEALSRAVTHASHCFGGALSGSDDLARAELKFYQGDIRTAEVFIIRAMERALEHGQFEVMHRALFYTMRCAAAHGDWAKAEKVLDDMKGLLEIKEYSNRFFINDTILSWHYCYLDLPDLIPNWLKDKFAPYGHAYFIENLGNLVKARYCYLKMNYSPLLAYLAEQRHRESILFGRIEMLALEACTHYKMKNKSAAFTVLQAAYEEAHPNDITMPFVELGKDMRTLSAAALKEASCNIPSSWLEAINRQATTYAKRKAHIISQYNQINNVRPENIFSPRELEILSNLSQGLSRSDIAVSCNLSINTVKMVINNIYNKLGVKNLADLIRVAVEQNLV